MAQITMDVFAPAAVVGVLSAAANVVEKQAKERGNGNVFFTNASLWGDVGIGAYAIINYTMPRPMFPTRPEAVTAMAGAGTALLARRAADWIGATMLNLPTGARHTRGAPAIPGRSMQRGRPSLRFPGAAVETGVLPRKRQFFSVT